MGGLEVVRKWSDHFVVSNTYCFIAAFCEVASIVSASLQALARVDADSFSCWLPRLLSFPSSTVLPYSSSLISISPPLSSSIGASPASSSLSSLGLFVPALVAGLVADSAPPAGGCNPFGFCGSPGGGGSPDAAPGGAGNDDGALKMMLLDALLAHARNRARPQVTAC